MSGSTQPPATAPLGLQSGLDALEASDEFRGPVESMSGNDSNDHLALIYESRVEQLETAIPFVRQGLADGERCMYVCDEDSKPELVAGMREGGIDVDAAVASGALSFHTVDETYLRNGSFDPNEMIEFYSNVIAEATEEYEALRVTAETSWLEHEETSVEEFVEYEAKVNDLFADTDCIALCQYDRTLFRPEVVRDVVTIYPHLVYDGAVIQNFYYTPPEEFFGPDRPDREIDRMLGVLRDRTVAKTMLQTHEQFLQQLYETVADSDSTFEEKVRRLLEVGREYLDLDVGFLSHVDGDRFEIVDAVGSHELIQPGSTSPVAETYCRRVLDVDGPMGVQNAGTEGWEGDTAYEKYGLESFLGISVGAGAEPDGTLCFADTSPREEPFSEGQQTFVELMGEWLSYELDRQERERELRERKDYLRALVETTPECIKTVADDGTLLQMNPAGLDMVEADESVIGECVYDVIAPEHRDRFREFNERICDGESGVLEFDVVGLEGTRRHMESHAAPLRHPDGTVDHVALTRDITERKEHERSQRALYEIASDADSTFEEKLQALFDLGRDRFDLELGGMAKIDPATDHFEVEAVRGDHEHLRPGAQVALSETYCRVLPESDEVVGITDPADGFEGTIALDEFGVNAYLGTQIELEGRRDRSFFFVATESREEPFTDQQLTFHRLMGQWVRYELEQRHRADRLAALNGLSRELMEPKTAVETSECVVTAAEETLDLPVAAVAINDEETGVLEPVAATDAAERLLTEAPLLDVGDGVGWEAFVNDAPRRQSEPIAAPKGEPTVSEVAAFPLGKQGVFVAGSTSAGGFSDDDYDFVETVAANTGAAFGRAHREQQLRSREATLEERTESLTRLDRVNTIIRSIDQALVGASSKAEIQRVVCEELADSGPYEFAWIGDYDSVTGGVTPAERAGSGAGYLDEVSVTAEGSLEELEPTGRALQAGEPQVVDEMVSNPPFEPWRQASLNRGYQSAVALPLSHDDSLFGVLGVYAGEPDVFDDLERAVLAELGDTIGYAMSAVKSKKALVSDEVTDLEFSIPDESFEIVELVRETGCEFVHENTVPQAEGGFRVFFRTCGVPAETIEDAVERSPIGELSLVSEHDDDGEPTCLFEAVLDDGCFASTVVDYGGRIDSLRAEDGVATVSVEIASGETVREFVEMLLSKYPEATLTAKHTRDRSQESLTEFHAALTDELTARQLEALRTAFHSGYFETPRTRTGSEVAATMDITQPTFNNHLRAGQRKLFGKLFASESTGA